jgi:hypothetical protein
MMIKLYKSIDGQLHYHEAWTGDGVILEHWGKVGEKGEQREHKVPRGRQAVAVLEDVLLDIREDDYAEIDDADRVELVIEYRVEGKGSAEDLDKRSALQDRMDEVLGWTGLGYCDGGSIGSGTMAVECFVVDFAIAKSVIESDLQGTTFGDYSRIYEEE